MDRRVCLHGHFYQPPRENPWLDVVEREPSARPHHDWNERITDECYRSNATARVLDATGLIEKTINNYAGMSFNVGPTLHAWLAEHAPDVDAAILDADRQSAERFSGHGSAIAQPYVHAILPLADARDRHTLAAWGIADFRHRFGRDPEGMWLPETAVDLPTLDTLAAHGIRFTILAPSQAAFVREIGGVWADLDDVALDTSMPYSVLLPSGRSIAVFFYDAVRSHAIAFDRPVLEDGTRFAHLLVEGFDAHERPQLLSAATDGETYGHHHRFGEMALAWALDAIERHPAVRLTNYAEHLATFPPTHEVVVAEGTSWSCAHGVRRWHDDCGCSTGGQPGWSQRWRHPLREALDWLRDRLAAGFETRGAELLRDPWAARDDYVSVLLDRSSQRAFLDRHAVRPLDAAEASTALTLLEVQRHMLYASTSCGWFFADPAGVETVIVLRQAARAVELAERALGERIEPELLALLADVRSNDPAEGDGARIWRSHVRPVAVDARRMAAVYATRALAGELPERTEIGNFACERVDHLAARIEDVFVVVGIVAITDRATAIATRFEYAAVDRRALRLTGGVREATAGSTAARLRAEIEATTAADVRRRIDDAFPGGHFNLDTLPREERAALVAARLPTAIAAIAKFASDPDLNARALAYVERAVELEMDATAVVPPVVLDDALSRAAASAIRDPARLPELVGLAALDTDDDGAAGRRAAQDATLALRDATLPSMRDRAARADTEAAAWIGHLRSLGALVGVAIDMT